MRSFSRSFLILLTSGASEDSLASLTSTFFSPVAGLMDHNSPCSPVSSRCTKESWALSGLHCTFSGARPVRPPGATMASMVISFARGFSGADCAKEARLRSKKKTSNRLTITLRGSGRCPTAGLKSVHRRGVIAQRIGNGSVWGRVFDPPPHVAASISRPRPRSIPATCPGQLSWLRVLRTAAQHSHEHSGLGAVGIQR